MAELKTKPTDANVNKFLEGVTDEQRRKDCLTVLSLMRQITKQEPKMWGDSIVGFGSYHYKYASGQEGDWPLTGFSPRKTSLTIYVTPGLHRYAELLKKLGKHSTGQSCLYIKKLADVDASVLKQLIAQGVKDQQQLVRERTKAASKG